MSFPSFQVPTSNSAGSSHISAAAAVFRESVERGIHLSVAGGYIEWEATCAPTLALVQRLRDHKPELIQILRGERCRRCGERLSWPGPAGVVFADGTAECMPCADREVGRIVTAAARAVEAPAALADEAETMLHPEGQSR